MNVFDIGDQVRLGATFTNLAGTLLNPTTVACVARKPDGSTTTLTAVNESTGVYHADVLVDQSGTWNARWAGTGTLVVAEETSFEVRVRRV